MKLFDSYAQYYDLLYKDKKYYDEVEYLKKLLNVDSSEQVQILELGCGTGLHAAELAKSNFSITAIDQSDSMLNIARHRIRDEFGNDDNNKVSIKVGDARTYRDNKKYDNVISIFHVASYQVENDDFFNFLKTAQIHLKAGGHFIFDFWYGPAVLVNKPEVRIKRYAGSEFNITRISEPKLFENMNRVDVNFDIRIEDARNKSIELLRESHSMRYFFMPELDKFIKEAGFSGWKFEEWMSGHIPSSNSWSVCVIATK